MNAREHAPAFWTPILYDVAEALQSLEDPEARIDRVLALMRRFVPYDRSALLEAEPVLKRSISVTPDASTKERAELAERLRRLLELVSERPLEEGPKEARPRGLETVHLAVPIIELGETTGIVFAERSGAPFSEEHLAFLSVVAAQIGAYLAALRAERALRASDARFRALYELGIIGIAFMDGNGRITDTNETFAAIVARSRDDLRAGAVSWSGVSPPDERARDRKAIREAIERGASPPYEKTIRRGEDRGPGTVLAGVARLESADSIAGFVVDISDQKRFETERAGLLEERAFLEMFIGMLGHDLRSPLNAIKMGAERLRIAEGDRIEKTTTRILASTERMGRMVRQLLDLTRIRLAGGMPLELRRVDLEQVCRRVIDELEGAIPDASIHLEVTGDTTGAWDGDRLLQVVSNLVANAVQHAPEKQGIRIGLTGTEEAVELTVHNVGVIPEELLEAVFEPFRRARMGVRHEGLGLGLFITKHIVEAHGGSIEVASSEAEGTIFTVRLPRKPPRSS